mmetsp:Transcript_57673/g.163770  ORF Transcript_57673/g.163770 Transcript_57673/m.163770 type:complete len:246 (+) Transcript_57673:1854-2591(+)
MHARNLHPACCRRVQLHGRCACPGAKPSAHPAQPACGCRAGRSSSARQRVCSGCHLRSADPGHAAVHRRRDAAGGHWPCTDGGHDCTGGRQPRADHLHLWRHAGREGSRICRRGRGAKRCDAGKRVGHGRSRRSQPRNRLGRPACSLRWPTFWRPRGCGRAAGGYDGLGTTAFVARALAGSVHRHRPRTAFARGALACPAGGFQQAGTRLAGAVERALLVLLGARLAFAQHPPAVGHRWPHGLHP